MLKKKPDSWGRLGFALVTFWAILCFMDILLAEVSVFNSSLNSIVVRQGYITALRGIFLFLTLAGVLAMTALLRRGLIIAPLVWIAQILRIDLSGQSAEMMKNLLFVSDTLNIAAFILAPVLLALLLWQSLERLDPLFSTGQYAIPALWLTVAALVSLGSLFIRHWSGQFELEAGFPGFGIILFVVGFILLLGGAGRYPGRSLILFFVGLILPAAVYMAIWGWYDGIGLALISYLLWDAADFSSVWLELMAIVALPLLTVLGLNQVLAWRRGEKLLEII